MQTASRYCRMGSWVVLVLASLLFACQTAQAVEVKFPDSNLEQAVRTAIGKPSGPIYQSDVAGVNFTTLIAGGKVITNLSGLEYCTDLSVVWLYGNAITDISPLANLTKLTEVYLWDNQIVDITPLSGLISLRKLFLSNNLITNIKPLVDNTGIGANDVVSVEDNTIDQVSLCTYVPDLESREVVLYYTGQCGRSVVKFVDANLEHEVRVSYRMNTNSVLGEIIYDTDLANKDFKTLYASITTAGRPLRAASSRLTLRSRNSW